MHRLSRAAQALLLASGSLATVAAAAQAVPAPPQDATSAAASTPGPTAVVITATRIARPAFDLPVAVDSIAVDPTGDAHLGVNLSEYLSGVPGLLARNRQNYAQDLQISMRGFGARSAFGIRGLRLYVDDIPATLPDGQGQISNVDLGSAERIEVLRGPYSALYGNASGGVIQVYTEDGALPAGLTLGLTAGSAGQLREAVKLSGREGPLGYVASASRFHTDGYREHSAATRSIGNLKATLSIGSGTQLTLIGNRIAAPSAQDPLGLTRAQFDADPQSVDATALSFDTRKSLSQSQGGVLVEHRFDATSTLRLLLYSGQRSITQFQAIPVGAQGNPLSPGGVIVLDRNYQGSDLRWTWNAAATASPLTLVGGLAWDDLQEHRLGYQNFIGSVLGVQGALRRDENNHVWNLDPYLQASWRPTTDWTFEAGVRRSQVRFSSVDHYIVGTNPDDSGRVDYGATLPSLGLLFAVSPALHLYANAGRGFETPTLNELAYRPNGLTGLNFDLRPARSTSVETGAKWRSDGLGAIDLALFDTRTEDEIVVLTNSGGRSTYQNAGGTRRRGLELSWQQTFAHALRAQLAATWLDATYSDAFSTCAGSPCNVPNQTIPAGNRMPGLARSSVYAALAWQPEQGWRGGIEARGLGNVMVNDANSDAAAGFATVGLHLGYRLTAGSWTLDAFGRIDNLFDHRYAGSVIVGESNGRSFEPAPGRNGLAGVSARLDF